MLTPSPNLSVVTGEQPFKNYNLEENTLINYIPREETSLHCYQCKTGLLCDKFIFHQVSLLTKTNVKGTKFFVPKNTEKGPRI